MPDWTTSPSDPSNDLQTIVRRGENRQPFRREPAESDNPPPVVFELPAIDGSSSALLPDPAQLAGSIAGVGERSLAQLLSGFARVLSQMAVAPAGVSVYDATLNEPGQTTPEISTNQLRQLLAGGTAFVFDTRTPFEYALGHIPGALNVAPKPDVAQSVYVSDAAEIARIVVDRAALVVLYCNGPFCGKSRRLGTELVDAGFSCVCRYQLGAPVWRGLVGTMAIAASGIRYLLANDPTAVLIDARSRSEYLTGSISRARNVAAGEVVAAKDDGRLPMNDFNTRVIVYGNDGVSALTMAEVLVAQGFNNVKFFDGQFTNLLRHLMQGSSRRSVG